jgi:IS1 family transposase
MPRTLLLSLLTLFLFACKEEAHEKEAEFELNKPEVIALEEGLYLGSGLCVYKYLNYYVEWGEPAWEIRIFDCHDFLIDTAEPTENVMKYRQGGLCFSNDCSVEPEKSFTMLMKAPESFIDTNNSRELNIFASKYNNSKMLYKHAKISYYIVDQDTLTFFKKYDKYWEELLSIAKPLKIENEDFSEYCNSKFCSTKDFLNPLHKINCSYGVESKDIWCYSDLPRFNKPSYYDGTYIPKCLNTLEKLSEKYGIILMHSGAFPAGDCDLGNWRYLKIDSLSKEHYVKLKDLVKHPDSTISSGL